MAQKYSDEAYKLAQIAATLMIGEDEADEPLSWEGAAKWAEELVKACTKRLEKTP